MKKSVENARRSYQECFRFNSNIHLSLQEERLEKEREIKAKLEEEEAKRKEQLAAMSMHFGGYAERLVHI